MASAPVHGAVYHGHSEISVGCDMGHLKHLPQIRCLLYFLKVGFLSKGELFPDEHVSFQRGTEHL